MNNKAIIIGVGVLLVGVLSFVLIKQFGAKNEETINPLDKPKKEDKKEEDKKDTQTPTTTTPTTTNTPTTTTTTTPTTIPSVVKSKDGTRIRTDASTTSAIVQKLPIGVKLNVVGSVQKSDGLWYKIVVKISGKELNGFVRSDVVSA
jgi:hypothetical protein